jgi:serine/threonine-protein kinase HipA
MAETLWGKVYFKDAFAGYLREEPGDRIIFSYDVSYINSGNPAISYSFPLRDRAYVSNNGLHPFFDNLVSEGWLEQAQSRLLGKRIVKRFELLLAFGADCAGAVSVIDPEPTQLSKAMLDVEDSKEMALLTSRASLSGVQPKLAVLKENGKFRPARIGELSTYIAKFSSAAHPDLIENEYLTTQAFKALLNDDVAELSIGSIEGLDKPALLIKRFDRKDDERIHFEEFNQLLNHRSNSKYDGAHKDMADFILQTDGCLPTQNYLLFRRIIVGLLLGNTDMHFKNFAMIHTDSGLRLSPSYDQACALLYQYKTVALRIAGTADLQIGMLKPNHIIRLGEEFGLSNFSIKMAVDEVGKNVEAAKQAIMDTEFGKLSFKNNLIKIIEKRWNGTFALIGKTLSAKQ